LRKIVSLLATIVILAAGAAAIVIWQTGSSNQQKNAEDQKQLAREAADRAREQAVRKACHDAVLLQLKAPATARWSGETIDIGPHPNMQGYVDSENGFSALLRSKFTCTQKTDGHGFDAYVQQEG
jgi:type II secretory pathway pseudopilin PulG